MKPNLMKRTVVWKGPSGDEIGKSRLVLWEELDEDGDVRIFAVIENSFETDAMGMDVWCEDSDALNGGNGINVELFHDLYNRKRKG